MIHWSDGWLSLIFGGGVAVAVYFAFALGQISSRLTQIETKFNIVFSNLPGVSEEMRRRFFGVPPKE